MNSRSKLPGLRIDALEIFLLLSLVISICVVMSKQTGEAKSRLQPQEILAR